VIPDEGGDESICGLVMGYEQVKNVVYKSIRRKAMRRLFRFPKLALFFAFVLALVVYGLVWAATVQIDAFSVEAQTLTVSSGTTTDDNFTANNSSILGDERDAYLELFAGTSTSNLDINAGGSGVVAFSAGSGDDLEASIVWDGDDDDATSIDYTGLGGVDLLDTTNDGIVITVVDWEGNALDMDMVIYTDSTHYSTAKLEFRGGGSIVPAAPVDYALSFDDDFTTGSGASGPATFSNVGSIELIVRTVDNGADISFGLTLAGPTRDFGDLPAAYAGITTEANGGARHTVGATYFGSDVDAELDVDTPSDGDSDDNNNDDEDGVTRVGKWTEGTDGGEVSFTITSPMVNSYACVDGWIDWNDDGDFQDTVDGAAEHVIDSVLLYDLGFLDNLNQTFDVPDPATDDVFAGTYYARWRLSPDTDGDGDCNDEVNVGTSGYVTDGEVEDYKWEFGPNAVTLSAIDAGPALAGWPAFALVVAMVAGGAGLFVWKRRA
jgi:hypothetical protein